MNKIEFIKPQILARLIILTIMYKYVITLLKTINQ